MNQELKIQWLEALGSGRYQKGSHVIRNNEGFGCLGVLCDTLDPAGWVGTPPRAWRTPELGYWISGVSFEAQQVLDLDYDDMHILTVVNEHTYGFESSARIIRAML